MRRARAFLLSTVVVCLAVAGCGSQSHERSAPSAPTRSAAPSASSPSVGPIPTLSSVAGLALPVQPYLLTEQQDATITSAVYVLTRQCMSGFGFDYRRPPPEGGPVLGFLDRRYGITDPSTATHLGYHVPGGLRTSKPPGSNVVMTPDELTALTGNPAGAMHRASATPTTLRGHAVPANGCIGEADREVSPTGSPTATAEAAQRINQDGFTRSQHDPEVAAALTAWSRCLAARGYSAATPLDLPPTTMQLTTPSPSAAEMALAVADVACKRSTNLIGVWFTVETAYEKAMMAPLSTDLTGIRRNLDAELAAAAHVLGTAGR